MFVFPPCGGFTFRILHASSSVRPEEETLCIAVGLSFAAAAAYLEDADACLYASIKARPRTRVPVRTTCASIRCAWWSVLDFEIEANPNDSRQNISARALTMSLSCVTDKQRVASMLAWKRYTASDVNLIAGGEMKVTAARRESNFSMTATGAESY